MDRFQCIQECNDYVAAVTTARPSCTKEECTTSKRRQCDTKYEYICFPKKTDSRGSSASSSSRRFDAPKKKRRKRSIRFIRKSVESIHARLYIWVVLKVIETILMSRNSRLFHSRFWTKLVSGTSWMPRGTSRGTCTAPSDSCGGGRSASSGTPFDRKISDWLDIPS